MIVDVLSALLLLQAAPAQGVTVLGAEFYAYDEDDPDTFAVRTGGSRAVPNRAAISG
jgi:hypothetical protein